MVLIGNKDANSQWLGRAERGGTLVFLDLGLGLGGEREREERSTVPFLSRVEDREDSNHHVEAGRARPRSPGQPR